MLVALERCSGELNVGCTDRYLSSVNGKGDPESPATRQLSAPIRVQTENSASFES